MKVAKFGGTSCATSHQLKKVLGIITADPDITCVVVSAPGKRFPDDTKITDLLIQWYEDRSAEVADQIVERFVLIARDFNLDPVIVTDAWATIVKTIDSAERLKDYIVSRGEMISGLLVSHVLRQIDSQWEFADPESFMHFDERGRFVRDDEKIRSALLGKKVVVPGFYGSGPNGNIVTFSRGGSDVTGAVLARALDAEVYENWTDVPGILMADPRIVSDPHSIDKITYREVRELSYMGAGVLHPEAMLPVWEKGIPIHLRNTNEPHGLNTKICASRDLGESPYSITGIAGRGGFVIIRIEKRLMNEEVGFAHAVLAILADAGVSVEHMPGSIDTLSLIIHGAQCEDLQAVIDRISEQCEPDMIEVIRDIALIAVVGEHMYHRPGTAAMILGALSEGGINVVVINQGSSESNILIGVQEADFAEAVRLIYRKAVSV